jgi:hypothetical protein
MKRVLYFLLIFMSVIEAGCATMFMGKNQFIKIESDPPGATVKVGDEVAITPAIVLLRRKDDYVAVVEKSGYEPIYSKIESRFNYGMFLNLLILFPPGMIVDAATGAAWTLNPDKLNIKLLQK